MTTYICSQVAASLSAGMPCVSAVPRLLSDLWASESGQDMIEYALVAATIGLGTVAGVHGLAASVANYLNIVDGKFDGSLPHH